MSSALPFALIAEDNELVAQAMRVLFEASGFRVGALARVGEIIAAARAEPVDLLLLDLGLADGDGFDVLAGLRSHSAMPRAVVALTGQDDPDIAARCRAEGCAEVLVKPVPIRELVRLSLALIGADH